MTEDFSYKIKDYEYEGRTTEITVEESKEFGADFLLYLWTENDTSGMYFNSIEFLNFLEQLANYVMKVIVKKNNLKSDTTLREEFQKELERNTILQEALFDISEIEVQKIKLDELKNNSEDIRKRIKKIMPEINKEFFGEDKSDK